MTIKTLVIILSLSAAYFGSTWFYFGSSHPCEILVMRQKDYNIEVAERLHREDLQSWKDLARKALPAQDYDRFLRNIEEFSSSPVREENLQRSVMTGLRQKAREITPAQCAWQAVTWQPPRVMAADTSSQK
jgi:hypothetical protein